MRIDADAAERYSGAGAVAAENDDGVAAVVAAAAAVAEVAVADADEGRKLAVEADNRRMPVDV